MPSVVDLWQLSDVREAPVRVRAPLEEAAGIEFLLDAFGCIVLVCLLRTDLVYCGTWS